MQQNFSVPGLEKMYILQGLVTVTNQLPDTPLNCQNTVPSANAAAPVAAVIGASSVLQCFTSVCMMF